MQRVNTFIKIINNLSNQKRTHNPNATSQHTLNPQTAAYIEEMQLWHQKQCERALTGEVNLAAFLRPLGYFKELPPSKRLLYEPIKMAHSEEIVSHFASDENFFTDPRFRTLDYLLPYLADMELRLPFRREGAGMDYVFRLPDGAFAGIFHLYHVDTVSNGIHKNVFSIGYLVAPNQRGKGLATEAVKHICRQIQAGFPHLITVRAFADEHNSASRHLLGKIGFTQVPGTVEEGDELEYQTEVTKMAG